MSKANNVTLATTPATKPAPVVLVAAPVAAPVARVQYGPAQRITVVYQGNPKRPATQEFRRWACLTNGMQVGTYCTLLKGHGGNAASMLHHIVAKGWATIA